MSSEEANESSAEVQQTIQELTLVVELPKVLNAGDSLRIPSNYEEDLNDLRQSLLILPITKNFTNYNLFIQNTNVSEAFDPLASFSQIIDQLGLQFESELKIVVKEKPYTLASVFDQITRFREVIGLHYIDRITEDSVVSRGVSAFNSLGLTAVNENKVETTEDDKDSKEETKIDLSEDDLAILSQISTEISQISERSGFLPTFDNINDKLKIPIKSLTVSQWSPVPAFQKNKGDLLYLTLQTLEGEILNITCHFSGFFVNRSSSTNFNPEIKVIEKGRFYKHFVLYNLLEQVSPMFSKIIEENEVTLSSTSEHPETYLLPQNSTLAKPWIVDVKSISHHPDTSRSQLPLISNGVDGSDYVKDWNEDIQSIRDLPTSTIQERVLRDKLIQKSLHDFTKIATETSINIINGNLTPMNPNEEQERHIYLKNGIFYSSSATTADVYVETGADEAARYVAVKDLAGVKAMNRADIKGVHNLATTVVDYLGRRIICQAPVPGIFTQNVDESQDDEKVSYGLSTDGLSILEDVSFEEPLKAVGELFHLKAHKVELSETVKSETDLVVSKDTKGIKGSDGRKYIIDLFRTTPRDISFTESHFDLSKPETSYPHAEALIRHEAVAEWWKRKASALFKAETEKLEKEGKSIEGKDGEKPQIVLPTDQIVFNPDAFSGAGDSKDDQDVVKDISTFIKDHLIKEFLVEYPNELAPFDGTQLTESLHRKGINLRYLGFIAKQALVEKKKSLEAIESTIKQNEEEVSKRKVEQAKKEEQSEEKESESEEKKDIEEESKEETEEPSKATIEQTVANFDILYKLSIQEMIARASKHILRKLTANVPPLLSSYIVVHFHNCLLGSKITESPTIDVDQTIAAFLSNDDLSFTKLNTAAVTELVQREVFSRFRFELPQDWLNILVNPAPLLREISIKFGIQWKAQEYVFTKEEFEIIKESLAVKSQSIEVTNNKKKGKKSKNATVVEKVIERNSIFVVDDIVNFVPNVKDSSYKPSLLDEIFQGVRSHLSEDQRELGFTLLNELLSIHEQIYGRVNIETARLYPRIAQIYAELGDDREAALISRKAVIVAERTSGFDSFDAINAYMNSGYYESATLNFTNSFKLYQHAINTWTSVFGKEHPALINTLTNLADNLFRVNLFAPASKLFEQALELSIKINGEYSQISGVIYFRLATLLLHDSKFNEALGYYVKAQDILTKLLGPDDSLSKQASKYVSTLTTYQEYLKVQEQQKKKQIAEQAASSGNNKVRVKSNHEIINANNSKKNGNSKKNNTPQSDPEIASKSIEDILNFIEGNQPKKGSKKATKKSKR